jgi:hypothetical protein
VLAADIKPGDGSTPVDTRGIALQRVIANMGADGTTPGRAIAGPVDRYTKDAFDPTWQSAVGDAIEEIVFDKGEPLTFYVSPGVTGSLWARIQWMVQPPALPEGGAPGGEKYVVGGAEASRVLGVPDVHAEDLHHYLVAMALLKGSKNTQNLPKSQVHAQLFVQSINTQAQVTTGVNPNLKALPFVNEIAGAA